MFDNTESLRLISFEITPDGISVRLIVENTAGRAACIELTTETLITLLMLLPASGAALLQRAQSDPRRQNIYPLADFQLEHSQGNGRILTLETLDGQTRSFSLSDELWEESGCAHLDGGGRRLKTH
jgi:hypothetical protein